nr:lipocalin-like domain protein [uncultured bacterium]
MLEGNTGTVNVAFSNASNFNGNTAALNSFSTLNGSVNGNSATVTVTNGARELDTSIVANNLAQGTTIDLSDATATTVIYTDTNGTWTALDGTVTVSQLTSTGMTLTFNNVVLTNTSGGSTGSATISGTVTFVAS